MRWLAALAALLAVATAGIAHAAFVDTDATPQPVGADRIERWLALAPADAAAGCKPSSGAQAVGQDGDLRVIASGASSTLECAFVLRARPTLPEGVDKLTVSVAPDGAAAGPLAGAAVDGTADLAGGEGRPVRVQLNGQAGTGRLLVTVRLPGENAGFLRYSVPVTAAAPGGGTPGGGDTGTPGGGGGGGTTGGGGSATPTTTTPTLPASPTVQSTDSATPPTTTTTTTTTTPQPTVKQPKPTTTATSRRCVSRRVFPIQVRLPRGERLRRGTARIARKSLRVREHGGSLTATVDLRGRKPGLYKVTVMVRTRSGKLLRFQRTYRTCATRGAHR